MSVTTTTAPVCNKAAYRERGLQEVIIVLPCRTESTV